MRTVENFDYTVRKATPADIEAITALAVRFFHESNNRDLTINTGNYKKTLREYIGHPFVASIIAVNDAGQVLGYAHIYVQTDFTVERIGEMYQFYVAPECRGTGVSRSLAEAAVMQYHDWNCARCYVEGGAGLDNPRELALFRNLWGRYGYDQIGVVMMKELAHGRKSTETDRAVERPARETI